VNITGFFEYSYSR